MKAAIPFTGIVTAALDVKNLDAAIEWYTGILGFEVDYKMPEIGWAELKTPLKGLTIGVGETENPETKGGVTLTFDVEDVDTAYATMKSMGVKFEGEPYTVADYVRLVSFYDPDGNKFMLAKVVKK